MAIPWLIVALVLFGLEENAPFVQAEQTAPEPAAEFRETEPSPEKERLAAIATYLLIAVVIAGMSLLIVVILWGGHVRRQVRKPLPNPAPKDPLWYLKPKRQPASEPSKPPAVSESENDCEDKTDAESEGAS